MATNQSIKNNLANKNNQSQAPAQQSTSMKSLLASPAVIKRFEEVLGKRGPQFTASILSLYNSEKMLQKCEPMSIISSAMVAATLDLPVDKNLGYMYIVPYGNKAQPQMGYKGYIQLALRSAQYRYINVTAIHEGELKKWNPLTEEIDIDFESRASDVIVGYAAYFELLNGFRKTVYWTKDQVEKHRRKFSKSDFGWRNDWDAMAMKTVLKSLLSKWGILSIEMQKAVIEDEDEREIKDITSEINGIDLTTDRNVIESEPEPESTPEAPAHSDDDIPKETETFEGEIVFE